MNCVKATAAYEEWLGERLRLIPADLERKHAAMASGVFPFLRATFYRWCQCWAEESNELSSAPKVLSAGDLHVENFGTWRDVEGRLVWGINDFDEAYELPYTFDLVRLAASALLAIESSELRIDGPSACRQLLTGYRESLEQGGRAVVLAEQNGWLRRAVTGALRDPERFWSKLDALPTLRGEIPGTARRGLERMLPKRGLSYRTTHRTAGLGSLGRERYVAQAEFGGSKVAREAKALTASAAVWAGLGKSNAIRYQQVLDTAVRSKDPFVRPQGKWIVRRLAPDCSRIELGVLERERDEAQLLSHMGFETANVHLGTAGAVREVHRDLKRRNANWLWEAAEGMVKRVRKDWEVWVKKGTAAAGGK